MALDNISRLSAVMQDKIAAVERELMSCVLADAERFSCADGVKLAQSRGIRASLFMQEDLRIIFIAAEMFAEDGLEKVLLMARAGLQRLGHWDDAVPWHSRGSWWSNENLWALADAWPGPQFTIVYATKLLGLLRRANEALEHIEYAEKLLSGKAK